MLYTRDLLYIIFPVLVSFSNLHFKLLGQHKNCILRCKFNAYLSRHIIQPLMWNVIIWIHWAEFQFWHSALPYLIYQPFLVDYWHRSPFIWIFKWYSTSYCIERKGKPFLFTVSCCCPTVHNFKIQMKYFVFPIIIWHSVFIHDYLASTWVKTREHCIEQRIVRYICLKKWRQGTQRNASFRLLEWGSLMPPSTRIKATSNEQDDWASINKRKEFSWQIKSLF